MSHKRDECERALERADAALKEADDAARAWLLDSVGTVRQGMMPSSGVLMLLNDTMEALARLQRRLGR